MNLFNRLPGFPRTPAGKERLVLRFIPRTFFFGTLLLAMPSLLAHLTSDLVDERAIISTDIYVVSLIILHWTVLLTVGIAAFTVMLMKGPAYVADAYPLHEVETLDAAAKRPQHC
jgi:hypothetical protein